MSRARATSDPDEFIRSAVEVFRAGAPSRQCLVIDDVHHIPDGSPTARLLADLLEHLPANASLTLASRSVLRCRFDGWS